MHLYEPIFPARHIHFHSSLMWRILLLLGLLLLAPFLAGCRHSSPALAAAAGVITLSSSSLESGTVPRDHTCDGEDASPPLKWTAVPSGTRAFALIVTDPDAPGGTFTHWVVYNLPAGKSELGAGVAKQDQLADGTRQGRNDFGKVGYSGPCPPRGAPHRYVFTLYALNNVLDVPARATRATVEGAMQGHVIAQGEITARYGR